MAEAWWADSMLGTVLFSGSTESLRAVNARMADRDGPLLLVQTPDYSPDHLVEGLSISTNTAASGGNARLMNIG